ncbi:MAG: hypothetical protein P4M01_01680 [Acidobacteriota bacterium]|nr:hypothetical protein [Acidobacteriota bacterium]
MISPRASSEAAGQSNPGYREARIVRLLFVGGCHTVGYPFGPEHGFPRLACEELQRQHARTAIECEVLPYVSLRRADVILEKCRAVRPDILVLQLGHYETEAVLKSRLWALISRRRPARESASSSSSLSSSAASSSPWTRHAASFSSAAPSFAATSSTRVSTEIDHPEGGRSRWPTPRRIAKYWTDLLLCAAGLPVVNLNEVRRQA